MTIHLIIRDLGGAIPVININGASSIYAFLWDKRRCGHVRSYGVGDADTLKRFRREQADILCQRNMWPIYIDVEDCPSETAGLAAENAELKSMLESTRERVVSLEEQRVAAAELAPRPRGRPRKE